MASSDFGQIPPSPPSKSPPHPCFSVSNIKTHVPLTLDLVNINYSSWKALFVFATKAYECFDHIDSTVSTSTSEDEGYVVWQQVDDLVLS